MFNKKKFQLPLDKFINNALYDPKHGYYTKKIPFGKNGDFITSPNISKIFSEMIFLWIFSYWEKFYKNKKINIVELGAGNGEMINQIIVTSKKFKNFYNNCDFLIFEKSENLIKLQKKKLKNFNVKWLKNLNLSGNKPTIFLGNEFLDALPVKQYINYKNTWYERYIKKKNNIYNLVNKKCDIKKVEKKNKFKNIKKPKIFRNSF